MIELVECTDKKEIFDSIWQSAWEEKGVNDEFPDDGQKYLVKIVDGSYIGTFEIFPFFKGCPLDTIYRFSSRKELLDNKVIEIDKVAIRLEYRLRGYVKEMVNFFLNYAIENDCKYVIALIDQSFYGLLKTRINVPIHIIDHSLDKEREGVVPIIVDVEEVTNRLAELKLNISIEK